MGETVVVEWVGDIDLSTAWEAGRRLLDAVERVDVSGVVVDLGAVDFLDSVGIGALLTARNTALGSGVELALRNVSERAKRVLDVTGIASLFPVDGTPQPR